MAIKKKIKYNIDKKRLCYRQPEGLFDQIKQHPINSWIEYDSFSLHIIDDGRGNSDKEPVKIKAQVVLSDNTLLGDFVFHNSAKYDGYCFFTFANKALYQISCKIHGETYNCQQYLTYIADVLEMDLNDFTEVEIACDVNHNVVAKVRKLIKDYENYDMFVNGKRITDENRIIENYGEYFSRSRKKLSKQPTLYFTQKKEGSPILRIYNKTREINEASMEKEYITQWDEFGSQSIYRIEVNVRNEFYKDFANSLRNDADYPHAWGEINVQDALFDLERYRAKVWQFFCDRMVYFRAKWGDKQVITLTDIAQGMAI